MAEEIAERESAWELESGLPNDVDGWMRNCRFGVKEEYMQQLVASGTGAEGLMFLFDLVDENGELIGNAGYTVGSGWKANDDGTEITHAVRKNVVNTSRYGQLQYRAVKELKIDMDQYGEPTVANSWEGLGFHWMLESHETLKQLESGEREKKQGLMPTQFLGVNESIRGGEDAEPAEKSTKATATKKATAKAGASTKSNGPKMDSKLESDLKDAAQGNDFKTFIRLAVKKPGVAADDDLMSYVMDDGPEGFFQSHQD